MDEKVSFGALNYAILFVYMAAMLYMGIRLAGKQEDTEDLFLGGKKLPWLAVGMSFFASLFSAISYMGAPGVVYAENASAAVGVGLFVITVPLLVMIFYPFYRKLRVTTTYQYIGMRYGRGARVAVSVLFLLARLGWLSVVIYAPAVALSTVCGLDLSLSIALMGVIAIAYTAIGGLAAVVWTDAAQFVILTGALVWVIFSVGHNVPGGVPEILAVAKSADKMGVYDWTLNIFKLTAVSILINDFLSLMTDLGTDQVAVQRVLGVKDFKGVLRCTVFGGVSGAVINFMLIFAGLGLFAYFQAFPERLAAGISADRVLPFYIIKAMPAGVSGLVITGIFAAAMSSVSAGTNSVVTVIFNDLIKPNRRGQRDSAYDLRLSRWLTCLVGAVCIGMAFYATALGGIVKAVTGFLGMFSGPSWFCS